MLSLIPESDAVCCNIAMLKNKQNVRDEYKPNKELNYIIKDSLF